MAQKGINIDPTTRFEITFKQDNGCTLGDAELPTSLFFKYAGVLGLDRPATVPDWQPGNSQWSRVQVPPLPPAKVLRERVESSPELDAIAKIVAHDPDLEEILNRLLTEKIDTYRNSNSL